MSAHLVERSEEDSFTAVVGHVADLLNDEQDQSTELAETPGSRFAADCGTLIAEGQLPELLSRLLSQSDLLFSKAADKDLECCINVICHLVARLPAQARATAAQQVAQSITAKADSRPEARLQGLSELYNVLPDPQLQYNVLLELLQYSIAAGVAHHLIHVIRTGMDAWPAELQLAPQQTRTLYMQSADVLRASKRKKVTAQREAYKLTLKTLELLDGASTDEVAACKSAAATAAADFIRSPETFQFDMLDSPAVQQLQSDPQHGPVFQLLSVLLAGNVQAFESLAKESAGVFETVGASREDVLTKVRLMALLGLGAQAATLSFEDVQTALNVSEGEVEVWIVRAIGKKLLDARIDQLGGTISITRCNHRAFGPEQWRELRDRLGAWARNVAGVKQLVADQAANGGPQLPPLPQAVRA
jgi:translation initiation factor 3 subunit M